MGGAVPPPRSIPFDHRAPTRYRVQMQTYVARLGVRDLIRYDRKRGARAVVALVRRHRGSITGAAKAAGVHHATFKRWIADLGLRSEIETIRERAGLSPARTLARSRALVRSRD